MRFAWVVALVWLGFLGACGSGANDASNAGDTGAPPAQFRFAQGHGYVGGESVEWNGGELIVIISRPDGDERHEVAPGPEAWKRFWDRLQAIGVWRWEVTYSDPERQQMDGSSWQLEIVRSGRRLECRGYNATPSRYPELVRAVDELTGGLILRAAG